MSLELVILENLLYNEEYTRKVIPFLKSEYFSDYNERVIYETIDTFFKKFNVCPSIESLSIDLSNVQLNENSFKSCKEIVSGLSKPETNTDWLMGQTEKWCQEKAIYNALMHSISILDDKSGKQSKGAIPQILSDAIAVSFDTHIGHDFIDDFEARYEFYHKKEVRIPFDLDYMNKITGGGLPRKTLNIIIAGTNVGKSLFMCHCAAANLIAGSNVLYITLEMSEERIAERIDANLLDITMDELKIIPKDLYDKKINRVKQKTVGKLIVKEYPTAAAGSANFRHLINELKIKRNFVPDIIYIDYLNICSSSRLKLSSSVNSYTLVKAIAEELRGLAVENNVPIVSATQVNRSGFTDSDFGIENTSESFGLPATADFMVGLISTEELAGLNQIMVKQLKNRYGDPNINKRFVVGIDRSKMRLYDVEQEAQTLTNDDISVFDNSKFGHEDNERSSPKKKFNKKMFDGFK